MEAKLEQLKAHPDREIAEELLRFWVVLRSDVPLPIYMFHPKFLVNLRPSRLDLKSELKIVDQPAELDKAVQALLDCNIALKYDFAREPFIRLTDDTTSADVKLLLDTFIPNNGADGSLDPFITEMAVFMFTITPQSGVGVFYSFHYDRMYYHIRELVYLLLARYNAETCAPALKQLLKSENFCFFMLPLLDRSMTSLSVRQDWSKKQRGEYLAADFDNIKSFMEDQFGQEALKTHHRLRMHWEGQLDTYRNDNGGNSNPDAVANFLEIIENFKKAGYGQYLDCGELAAAEILRFGLSIQGDTPKPEAKSSLRRILVGFENGDFIDPSAPDAYKRAMKGLCSLVLSSRLFEPHFELMARPLLDAAYELPKITEIYVPFATAMEPMLEMIRLLSAPVTDPTKLAEKTESLLHEVSKIVGARGTSMVELRPMLAGAIATLMGAEAFESFLQQTLEYGAKQYGKRNHEYICLLTDCLNILSTSTPNGVRSPMQHEVCVEMLQYARETYDVDSETFCDILSLYVLHGDFAKPEFESVVDELAELGMKRQAFGSFLFLSAFHTGIKMIQIVKSNVQKVDGMLSRFETALKEADQYKSTPPYMILWLCRACILFREDPDASKQLWNYFVEETVLESESAVQIAATCLTGYACVIADMAPNNPFVKEVLHKSCEILLNSTEKLSCSDTDPIFFEFFSLCQALVKVKDAKGAKIWVEKGRDLVETHKVADLARYNASAEALLPDLEQKIAFQERAQARKAALAKQKQNLIDKGAASDDSEESDEDDDDSDYDSDSDDEPLVKGRRRVQIKQPAAVSPLVLVGVAAAATIVGIAGAFLVLKFASKKPDSTK